MICNMIGMVFEHYLGRVSRILLHKVRSPITKLLLSRCCAFQIVAERTASSRVWKWTGAVEYMVPGDLMIHSSVPVTITPATISSSQIVCEASVCLMSDGQYNHTSVQEAIDVQLNGTQICVTAKLSSTEEFHRNAYLDIRVPLNYDIIINEAAGVNITGMESESMHIFMDTGSCELVGVKTVNTSIKGSDVNVLLKKPFLGNLDINVKNGSVMADRIQGQNIIIKTESGNIRIKSLYAVSSALTCAHGDIMLGQCHGSADLHTTEGVIGLQSCDGSVCASVSDGDINVHLSRHDEVHLSSYRGTVSITLPETSNSQLNLECKQLEVDDQLVTDLVEQSDNPDRSIGSVGGSDIPSSSKITVKAFSVKLHAMDWITAQKITFGADE